VLTGGVIVLSAPAASAATVVNVLTSSQYVDSSGDVHIVGEVRDDGTTNVQFIQLNLQYFDAGNTLLSTDSTYTSVDRLVPGEKSPFHLIMTPQAGYDHYTISVSPAATPDPPNHNFTTVVTNESVDSTGAHHIVGTVQNDNTTDADFVAVVLTFYDNGGNVVNEDFTYTTDSTVPAGASSAFEDIVNGTPAYSSYAIVTQSSTPGSPNPSASPKPSASASPKPTSSPSPGSSPTPNPSPSPGDVTPTVSLAPSVISAGQRVTVSYQGAPNATLEIWSKTQPATSYSRISSVTLNASGFGTSSHAPTKNTRIMAKTAGGLTSATPLIQVRSVASLSARRVATRTYSFTGRVYPARTGRLVSLYRNGALVAQARTDASGVYAMTKTLAKGTFSFQVRTGDDTYNLGASSPARTVSIS
jgi:hypothetical protein